MDADERLGRAHRLDQRANADDGHDTFEIVGQHVQCHFGADPGENHDPGETQYPSSCARGRN